MNQQKEVEKSKEDDRGVTWEADVERRSGQEEDYVAEDSNEVSGRGAGRPKRIV